MYRLSRRSLLKAAARLGAGAALAALGIGKGASQAQDLLDEEGPYFRESATTLTLGNRYYEVDFDRRNGAITRIFDKRGGGNVSTGNLVRSLWEAVTNEDVGVDSHSVHGDQFRWQWEETERQLSFDYEVRQGPVHLSVGVDVELTEDAWLDFTARIKHQAGPEIKWFRFPNQLQFDRFQIQRAFYPYLPGLMLQKSFFRQGRSYRRLYPGADAFADFTWIETDNGTLAAYPIRGRSEYWQTSIGYAPEQDKTIGWFHDIALAIQAGDQIELPTFRISVGESVLDALGQYRVSNLLYNFATVEDKLGDIAEAVLRSPLLKLEAEHLASLGLRSYGDYRQLLQHMQSPALLHPVSFQEQPFDMQNPDMWPPKKSFGGADEFLQFFSQAQREASLLMPYSNPTWWNPTSSTFAELAAAGLDINDLAAHGTSDGRPWIEGEGDDESPGWVVSPADSRVQARLAAHIEEFRATRSDLVFEDQVGARPWMFDYHPAAANPVRYTHGWLQHTRTHMSERITVEGGYDRLAETVCGFFWSVALWGPVHGHHWWGEGNWESFPASATMFRRETLLYEHDLGDTGTLIVADSLSGLRWCLVHGHQLVFDMVNYASPWLNVVFDFAHFVLGHYASELLRNYRADSGVSISSFESHTVTADREGQSRGVGSHALVPNGVVSAAHDGSVTGDVFERYNGRALTPGEHYLIEQRKPAGLIMRQPMGPNTPIVLRAAEAFGSDVMVTAFTRGDERLSNQMARIGNGNVSFRYERIAATPAERRLFEASIRLGSVNREDGLREVDFSGTTTIAEMRDGRGCRREVQMTTSEAQHGYIAFGLARNVFIGESEADCVVDVEWWDGGGLQGSRHDLLGLVFDGAVFEESQRHSGAASDWQPAINDRQWKTARFVLPRAVFRRRVWSAGADIVLIVPAGVCIGKVTVTNADELERRTVAYYTIHDPTQGETLPQGLHLRGWTDATQPIADLNLDGLQAIYAWDAEAASWLLYSPDVPARFYTLDTLEQGRAYYVRVRNGQTLHWPDAPYGGVGFHLQLGRNLVCWLGTPNKSLTDAIAPLRGMKAEPLVSVTLDGRTYDVEESRSATEPLPYGQALWVEIDAVGPTRWLQF